jgi:hypothetical protein
MLSKPIRTAGALLPGRVDLDTGKARRIVVNSSLLL